MRRISTLVLVTLFVACGGNSKSGGECGDGVVDGDESCDDGDQNGTGGCSASCTFVCNDPAVDCEAAPVCQVATCTTDHICIYTVDTAQNGTSCGTGNVCDNGACVSEGMCGNGVLEGSEQCDFGIDNGDNSGCETNCAFSCATSPDCNDNNPCNGLETCEAVTLGGNAGQQCVAGTPENDGVTCGTGLICLNEACATGTCGDSFTTSPEECDDANPTAGDGCETDCTYSCVTGDPTRNCTPADPCQGQGTCDNGTHTCTPGTPLDDDTLCGNANGYCKTGACTIPVCPNGDPEPGETCDDGNQNNGDGCDTDCTYSCVNAATDCGAPPACQVFQCSGAHTCQAVADPSKNGMSCGSNGETCQSGACTGGVCGNGVVEGGEECDFGSANNGPNTGCETNCQRSCEVAADCSDGNFCDGTETCDNVTVMGQAGKKCNAGTPPQQNTSCGTGLICRAQACVASVCGDSYVDAARGETCEPPSQGNCDAACNVMICGNGVRSLDEQCDDSNTANLDGCSASCDFEQVHRLIDLDLRYETNNAYCPGNRLGYAIAADAAKTMLTDAIDSGIADGSITIIFQFLGLDDLTGTSEPAVSLGILGGAPYAYTTPGMGTNDLDWWYTIDPLDLSGARVPTQQVTGAITAKVLNTNPGNMTFTVNFVGVDVTMDLFNTTLRAPIGNATTPTVSTGTPPGHTAAEHLDPTIQSFATMGSTQVPADLCGATTARSLDNTNLPTSIVNICTNYTIGNSFLDLYIGGCTTFFGLVTVIRVVQPDVSKTPGVTYTFQRTGTEVTGCRKFMNGNMVTPNPTLDECLDNAGYSSYYRLLTDRVVGK